MTGLRKMLKCYYNILTFCVVTVHNVCNLIVISRCPPTTLGTQHIYALSSVIMCFKHSNIISKLHPVSRGGGGGGGGEKVQQGENVFPETFHELK